MSTWSSDTFQNFLTHPILSSRISRSRTRIFLGLGAMAYATVMMYTTDAVAPSLGFEATEKDREELRRYTPRLSVRERVEEKEAEKRG